MLYVDSDKLCDLHRVCIDRVQEDANNCLTDNIFTILDKRLVAPSGNKQDYLTVAPYFHLNKSTGEWVRKDCTRNRASDLFAEESKDYDKTYLQYAMDNIITLALAYKYTGIDKYQDRACEYIRTWFINDKTRMNPNLKFSQMYGSHGTGIIDFKDFWVVLDSIKCVQHALDTNERLSLQNWCAELLGWLNTDPAGNKEIGRDNNHTSSILLTKLNLAMFCDNTTELNSIASKWTLYMHKQIDGQGMLVHEYTRPDSFHYCLFGLQLIINLGWCLDKFKLVVDPLLDERIVRSVEWMARFYRLSEWQLPMKKQISDRTYTNRALPIIFTLIDINNKNNMAGEELVLDDQIRKDVCDNLVFHPNEGIPRYWPLIFYK